MSEQTPAAPGKSAARLTWGVIGTVVGLATMGSALAWMIYSQQPRTALPAGTEVAQDKVEAMQKLADENRTRLGSIDHAIRRYAADPKQPATRSGK